MTRLALVGWALLTAISAAATALFVGVVPALVALFLMGMLGASIDLNL